MRYQLEEGGGWEPDSDVFLFNCSMDLIVRSICIFSFIFMTVKTVPFIFITVKAVT